MIGFAVRYKIIFIILFILPIVLSEAYSAEIINNSITVTVELYDPVKSFTFSDNVETKVFSGKIDSQESSSKPPEKDNSMESSSKPPEKDNSMESSSKPPEKDNSMESSSKPPEKDNSMESSSKPPEKDNSMESSSKPPEKDNSMESSSKPPEKDNSMESSSEPPEKDNSMESSSKPPEKDNSMESSSKPPEKDNSMESSSKPGKESPFFIDIKVNKSSAKKGDILTYIITFKNNSKFTVSKAEIVNVIPERLTFLKAIDCSDGNFSIYGHKKITCTFKSIGPSDNRSLKFEAQIN